MSKTKKKVYISGPITGIKDYAVNFGCEAASLMWNGYEPINPVTLSHNHDQSYESFMKVDLRALLDCDCIVMLSGWRRSKGARIEYIVAKVCGIKCLNKSTIQRIKRWLKNRFC